MGRRGGGSLSRLREANVAEVVEALRRHGSMTQAEIARTTSLSPATVSNIVGDLRERGIVRRSPFGRGMRRSVELTLSPTAGVVAGVDVAERSRVVAVGDLAGRVLAEDRRSLETGHRLEDDVPAIASAVCALVQECGHDRSDLRAVAVGVPGPIDPATGRLAAPSLLPGWAEPGVAGLFGAALGVPVVTDNDAGLAALGELQWGAARGYRDITYIKISSGIRAGLVLARRLYRGGCDMAGEIGHTTIDENGPVCRCGNRGCLELYAGEPALLRLLLRRDERATTVEELLQLSAAGDPGCRRVLEDAGRHVGVALANLCNLISPELIVVGGDLVAAGDALLQPMRDAMARGAVPAALQRVRIVPGELGDRAGALGALAVATGDSMHDLVRPPPARARGTPAESAGPGGGSGAASRDVRPGRVLSGRLPRLPGLLSQIQSRT